MDAELQLSDDLHDPFAGFSLLSLLRLTCAGSAKPPPPPTAADFPRSEPDEVVGAFRTFLSSMALKSSSGAADQAREIEKGLGMPSVDGAGVVAASAADDHNDRPQGRRPALNRKRAKFSLKPIPQSDTVDVDISSQVDHIEDPEEYFMTFEQLENAEKEMKNLRGESLAGKLHHQPNPTTRTRRPGILGKTASFKHNVSATDDIAEVLRSSQEDATARRTSLSSVSIIASSNAAKQPISSLCAKDNESGADKENSSNNLFNSLLSSFKNLKEGEEESFLRESLQLKAIAVDNMLLPAFQDTKKNEFRATSTNDVGSKSSSLSSLQASPNQRKNSYAEISNLFGRTSFKDPLHDLDTMSSSDDECNASKNQEKPSHSSPVNVGRSNCDDSPSNNSSGPDLVSGKSLSLSNKLETPITEVDISPDNRIAIQKEENIMPEVSMTPGHIDFEMEGPGPGSADFRGKIALDCPLANRSQECSPRIAVDVSSRSSDKTLTLEEVYDRQLDNMRSDKQDLEAEILTFGSADPAGTKGSAKSPLNMNEDHSQADGICDKGFGETSHLLNLQAADREMNEPARSLQISEDDSEPMTSVALMDGQSTHVGNLPVRDNETEECRRSSFCRNQENKIRSSRAGRNKQNLSSKRRSLADAGTMWNSGVRRSTRIKSKPLEFWRGERFLYGRIHDSLSTVIGIKYSSPGADGMKVKSFVSEEYSDLVNLVGRN